MLVQPLVDGGEPRLLRVEVTDVRAREWTVRLGKAGAAMVRTGDRCYMVRPQDMSAAQLRALPEVIPLTAEKESGTELLRARTLSNLSDIGLALHQFQDAHNFWPPAVLVGPDGKPWHSWRVLLLPLLGHRDLFDQYDFSQPWDSAKNLRLLDKMPAVFHDPIYGDKLGHFTNYAAVLGGGPGPKFAGYSRPILTAFSTSGVKMKDVTILPLERLTERVVTRDAEGEMRARTPRIVKIEQSDSLLIRVAGSSPTPYYSTRSPWRRSRPSGRFPGPSRRTSPSGPSSRSSSANRGASPHPIPLVRVRPFTVRHLCSSRTARAASSSTPSIRPPSTPS